MALIEAMSDVGTLFAFNDPAKLDSITSNTVSLATGRRNMLMKNYFESL